MKILVVEGEKDIRDFYKKSFEAECFVVDTAEDGELGLGFVLLSYFVKNPEVVLSRSMILEHVWDMSVDPFSNTIESHIMSLRKKIEYAGKSKLVKTVPGAGYKLEVSIK